jgi:hypothetical protein
MNINETKRSGDRAVRPAKGAERLAAYTETGFGLVPLLPWAVRVTPAGTPISGQKVSGTNFYSGYRCVHVFGEVKRGELGKASGQSDGCQSIECNDRAMIINTVVNNKTLAADAVPGRNPQSCCMAIGA